ncbi:TPA: hypothetical protein KDX83_004233 [Vibrio parahaemolyticus]|uniref:hypothetical protein n=1 Tax=Vibrio harveyi group TaxID=717610 RepID=UPI001B82A618|nr:MULTISPECIES: hypothetical protein [Vibrio harveyi group]MCX4135848.1 hypothetical protein [Vibrio parahaemolyticus]MCZ6386456.1 hypothetical protein [Vibrio parahaemolyticus]MDA0385928.1 hypothetical protein [Vibrio owensii]HBC0002006.1 hypothetical protein [Vibrio parahaemolyticus]HBC3388060.1 hypothetical protein [Vibrio parahaemolyticus]
MKYRFLVAIGVCFLLNGCFESKPVSVASIGNAGTLGSPHFIRDMWVSDIYGGGANFGYGAVQGCCASSSIGIGIPSAIKGEWENNFGSDYWKKEWKKRWKPEWGDYDKNYGTRWYRIDDVIDSDIAKQKIETMNHYYKNHHANPVMKLLVDGERILLLYAYACTPEINDDCTVREGADPNGWVQIAPYSKHKNSTVVVLYEGKGKVSDKPF